MQLIDKNNKIFKTNEYQKDKYKFYLISQNLKNDSVLLFSDEENYVVCRGNIGWPTWIWTKDKLTQDKISEVEKVIQNYFTDNEKDKFTCKKELYDNLVKDNFEFLNREDYFEMGTLCCHKVKEPRETDGKLDRATIDELDILTEYWFNDSAEMNNIEPISMEQAYQEMKQMINSDTFYVWRNNNGKIVCMVDYKVTDGQAKLSHVYTPIEERGKAYAANLIYAVTKNLLDAGLVPLLYTDYNYPASNKAYINAGYEDTGILINFSCSREKKISRSK